MTRFAVKARGPRDVVRRLSGGNVQKVLLGRELQCGGARYWSWLPPPAASTSRASSSCARLLDEHRRGGAAILLISEDLDEISDLADRIVVMYAGRLVLEPPPRAVT